MSIGKSSIARAVSSTNTVKAQNTTNTNIITSFLIDNIGTLTIAKEPNKIEEIKNSIAKRGILVPILIAVTTKGEAWLIDGYRRIAAARELDIKQVNAIVINVENKRDANNIYTELCKTRAGIPENAKDDIHEEKFRVLCVKDHDLPTYLL